MSFVAELPAWVRGLAAAFSVVAVLPGAVLGGSFAACQASGEHWKRPSIIAISLTAIGLTGCQSIPKVELGRFEALDVAGETTCSGEGTDIDLTRDMHLEIEGTSWRSGASYTVLRDDAKYGFGTFDDELELDDESQYWVQELSAATYTYYVHHRAVPVETNTLDWTIVEWMTCEPNRDDGCAYYQEMVPWTDCAIRWRFTAIRLEDDDA